MAAKRDGVLEGGDEDFAIWAGSQMSAYFSANVGREFVVDIGGQLPEKVYAMAFAMRMAGRRRRGPEPFLRRRCLFLGHERAPPGWWSS